MTDLIKTDKLEKEISPVVQRAQAIEVKSGEFYYEAGEFLRDIKSAQDRVKEFFEPIKKKSYDAWKSICSKEKEVLRPLDDSESMVKEKMIAFKKEEEKKRLAEERRLQAEADERARRERERLNKQAEKYKTQELKELKQQEAEEVVAPVVSIQSEVPKVDGISTRKVWEAEEINKLEFLKFVLENPAIQHYVIIDTGALAKFAQATKGNIKYPGIKFSQREIISSKKRS